MLDWCRSYSGKWGDQMKEDQYFLVYRIHDDLVGFNTNLEFYGWTQSKYIVKTFFKQRDKKKFHCKRIDAEYLGRYAPLVKDSMHMIDYIKLKSSKSGEEYSLFMTVFELKEVETNIQILFSEKCSLANYTTDGSKICLYCDAIMNLKDKYSDALDFIGYRPPEIAELIDSVKESSSYGPDTMEDYLDQAYQYREEFPEYQLEKRRTPGSIIYSDIANKVLYSIESFIKVMKDSF